MDIADKYETNDGLRSADVANKRSRFVLIASTIRVRDYRSGGESCDANSVMDRSPVQQLPVNVKNDS
jgi:hypothetical protein